MAFLALFNAFAMRANLTIAITRMVLPPNISAIDKNVISTAINNDISICPINPDVEVELANEHAVNHSTNISANVDLNIIVVGIILQTFNTFD